ncbi:MAG TPA: carboxylating nicotinate-nucleotide diphosphorylase [Candidatus Nitrosotenuis sp.]|nr:carboxylating nicotinate-nucleotide diphosphorylase [Candidatus Nitrosotenuis sp.]
MGFSPKKELARFLQEDVGRGDVTSDIITNRRIVAKIITRQACVIAGARFAREIFAMNKCRVKILRKDGAHAKPDQVVMEISGPARSVLKCERTALNLLSRMSGIATATNELVRIVKSANPKTDVYSTRKTAPGLRFFDKEAVMIGGGKKHRVSLSDMIMIKDNHIAAEGSIIELIRLAKKRSSVFEVEVDTQPDAIMAASLGVPIIMLDNFTPQRISSTISSLRKLGLRDKVRLEASGGINAKNVRKFAKTRVDMISIGSITNSAKAIDFSLEV